MSNTESISDKLRRWADESENDNRRHFYPTFNACDDLGINVSDDDIVSERELFRRIADEIDAEKREITERYARQSWMNPAEAIAKLATGEIEWAELQQAIDRYYLPRPLFEDGEPVQIGDRYLMMNGTQDIASSFAYTKGDADYARINGHRMKLHERVKRPKQTVLDADGVPIEVGDAVWILKDSGHVKWTVIEPYNRYDGIQTVYVESRGIKGHACPENITHREPDSHERIDRDALKSYNEYWGCTGIECKRFPALIDGKKPRHRYEVDWCKDTKTLDLLRRRRELDGRDA